MKYTNGLKGLRMDNNYIPNTSAIPNVLFDYWMNLLSPAEFKVLMCVARKTYGWHKNNDLISIKQIEKMTGLHRSGIIKNVDALVERGLLNKVKSKTTNGDDAPNRYEINVYCVGGDSLLSRLGVVYSVDYGVVYSVDPQKKDYTKENIQNNTPPIPPQNNAASAVIAASAAGECAGLYSNKKTKREKPDFSPKVREVANQMLNLLLKNCPVYRPPSDLTKFLTHVQDIIEKDQQDASTVLVTFEWAVSDNEKRGDFSGWQGIIATNSKGGRSTTPAEVFRKHFSKIHSQMNSKPKRRFAANSDQNAALEAMEEMNKRAL
jgi:phage replication O-like protein O